MRGQTANAIGGMVLIGLLALFVLVGFPRQKSFTVTAARLPMLAMTPTPVPGESVRLGAPRLMKLNPRGQDADYTAITVADVDGNLLAATATDPERGRTVLIIDLETGARTRLTDFNAPKLIHSLNISGDHVVWIEEETTSDSSAALHIVNLRNRSETQLPRARFSQVDFQDGVVAWQGTVDEIGGIYGYDIDAEQPFVIAQNAYAHLPKLPRVCNDAWLIYLLSPTGALPHLAELIAYNRVTDERISLGEVPVTINPDSAHQHACDRGLVAWVARRFEEVDGKAQAFNELHLFDLGTHTARVFDENTPLASSVLINGDLVLLPGVQNRGYDLASGASFAASAPDLPQRGLGMPVLLTEDRLVWIAEPEAGGSVIYVAEIGHDQ